METRRKRAVVGAALVALCAAAGLAWWRLSPPPDFSDDTARIVAGGRVGGPGRDARHPPPGVRPGAPLPNMAGTGQGER